MENLGGTYERKVDLPHSESPRSRMVTVGGSAIIWLWLHMGRAESGKRCFISLCRSQRYGIYVESWVLSEFLRFISNDIGMSYRIHLHRSNAFFIKYPSIYSVFSRVYHTSRSLCTTPVTKMESNGIDYASWSPEKLVARVSALEQQLKEANERCFRFYVQSED